MVALLVSRSVAIRVSLSVERDGVNQSLVLFFPSRPGVRMRFFFCPEGAAGTGVGGAGTGVDWTTGGVGAGGGGAALAAMTAADGMLISSPIPYFSTRMSQRLKSQHSLQAAGWLEYPGPSPQYHFLAASTCSLLSSSRRPVDSKGSRRRCTLILGRYGKHVG